MRGWTERYAGSRTDEIAAVDQLGRWLAERIPADGAPSLIHNDFKLDNLVLDRDDPTRVIGVLDWEMCTVGDPLMDLGTTLSYWIEAADAEPFQAVRWGPTTIPGSADAARGRGSLRGKERPRPRQHPLLLLLWAVQDGGGAPADLLPVQTGLTQDERFATLIHGVRLLAERGVEATVLGRSLMARQLGLFGAPGLDFSRRACPRRAPAAARLVRDLFVDFLRLDEPGLPGGNDRGAICSNAGSSCTRVIRCCAPSASIAATTLRSIARP